MQQFKVGDWVVEIHSEEIHQIIELFPDVCRVRKPLSEITYSTEYTDFIPWQPKAGEWCWFWDADDITPCLGKFNKVDCNGLFASNAFNGSACHFCEPFIGELPSFLKEQ